MRRSGADGHRHVAVFHGRDEQYSPGVVLVAEDTGWQVLDETGTLGAAGATYGRFPTEREACRAALALLSERYGTPLRPCWGAGAPERALEELGYRRGGLKWRWWPPRLVRSGGSQIAPGGAPQD